jgi:hypothetical protein
MTMPATFEQFGILDALCSLVCDKPKIRFCGIINSMGRLVAGNFKDSIQPLDNEQQRQMLYMQSQLELSMKEEFDGSLGNVNYVLTYRDNLIIINIPSKNRHYHVLISAEKIADVTNVVEYVNTLFEKHEMFSNKYPHLHKGKKIKKNVQQS